MKKFLIEDDFWNIFPDTKIGIVLASNINNSAHNASTFETMLRKAEVSAKSHLTKDILSENEVIREWREAYQKFKTKKGARSSIEALLNRVSKGNPINLINPLVDIYNSISLTYGLPCGGEDIDTFVGNVKLTKANGSEHFITLGTDENSPPLENEIVYKDDAGAICRCWNWRESVRTMLTEKTKHAFLCIELLDGAKMKTLESALAELEHNIQDYLSGSCKIHILDINNREIIIK
jgi:DNA/RNA-binding domain of Phe-tRNA-synthetase-like protein